MPSPAPLGSIGQIAVRAQDLARATRFYRDVLGLQFLFEAPGLAFFQTGDVRLMLTKPETGEFDHPGSILYFNSDDILASHATLAARGVVFRETPRPIHRDGARALWIGAFTDSEGNTLAVMQWRSADEQAGQVGGGN
jgi:predicted enzyme related to lactoylglutathione lyase